MSTIKLTEKAVGKLKAPTVSGKQEIAWDADLKGFGVLCSGVTEAKTYILQRTLPGGKTRRISLGRCNVLSLAEARKQAEAGLAQFFQGIDPKGPRGAVATLGGALEAYLRSNHRLAPASRKFYSRIIRLHLSDWMDTPLRDITPEMVQDRHRKIQETVAAGGHGKGHAMANSVMTTLGILFNHAAGATPTLINPVKRLRHWFDVPRRTTLVKFDQLPEFYRAVRALDNPIHRDVILMLLFTGLRLNEAAKLRWEEVDFAAAMIRIPPGRMKSRKAHDLPMNDVVRDLLVARRAIGRAELVFVSASNLKRAFGQIAKATGITVSAHDLRRTFITVAASDKCNISPSALKRLVAHTTRDVTEGYNVVTAEEVSAAGQRVADHMKALCGVTSPKGANVATIK